MNINAIEINKPYKYKELCTDLEIEPKNSTNSKKAQFKELECYFKIVKNKTNYIITEIYPSPIEKTDERKNKIKYIDIIELLLLDLLVQDENNGKVFLSKNKLLKSLFMINENYAYCKQRIPKLSEYTNVQKQTVEEWYLSTGDMLKRNLKKALDHLENQALILWSNEITVCELIPKNINLDINYDKNISIDEYGEETTKYKIANSVGYYHREATEQEKKFILHTERETIQNMGFLDKQQIIQCGKWEEFKQKINDIILDELKIAYYYNSYKIICNEDHIIQKWNQMLNLLLTEEERKKHLNMLNNSISKRLHTNIENKQKRAFKKIESSKSNNQTIKRRIKETYIGDNDKLVDTLINQEANDIRKDVRKIKIKKQI